MEVPVGDSSEVVSERLQYDNLTKAKKAVEFSTVEAQVDTIARRAIETVTAALAAEITEVNKKASEVLLIDFDLLEEAKKAKELSEVVSSIRELSKKSSVEDITFESTLTEIGRRAQELNINTVVSTNLELSKQTQESVSADFYVEDSGKRAEESVEIQSAISDIAKRAVEQIKNEAGALSVETGRKAIDSIQTTVINRTELAKKASTQKTVLVNLEGYITEVVSNSGFSNPANTIGNTTGTNATLTASASGLAGLTSNTTNGTLHARFRNTTLSDLTIASVSLNVETSATQGGLPLGGGWALNYQYSLDSGSIWTTFHTTDSAEDKGIRTVVITSPVGGSWNNINSLRVRATGSVTSGTGLGATRSALWFRSWVTLAANRTY